MEGRNGGKLVTNRQHNLNFLGVVLGPFLLQNCTLLGLSLPAHYHHCYPNQLLALSNSIGPKIVLPREEMNNANASNTEFLFGLFAEDEMSYRWGMDNGCSILTPQP